jgi:flagellar biosynthesis/type III secretory pathway protein FliH
MTRVIRCDQSARVVPALVGDATLRARLIIERAQAQAEQLRSEASAEGRAQGLATLSAAFAELAAARDLELAALEPHAIQIALSAAKQIVGEELALSPERVAAIVAPLIARLRRSSLLTLRLHPEDAAFVQHHASELLAMSRSNARIHIEGDAAISRGGCLVVSDIGSLDARLESRLDLMGRAMRASLQDSAAPSPKSVDER